MRKMPLALNNRGKLYEAMGDRDRAIADYATVLTLPKDTADTRQRQEVALARLGRLNQPKASAAPSAGKRVALVIGNSNYAHAGVLDNPVNDARGVTSSLRKLGFTVKDYYDLNRSQMVEALSDFGDLITGADWAVVFYAGHGVEMDGTNYLIPIDVRLKRDSDVPLEGVSLNAVLAKVDAATQLGLGHPGRLPQQPVCHAHDTVGRCEAVHLARSGAGRAGGQHGGRLRRQTRHHGG